MNIRVEKSGSLLQLQRHKCLPGRYLFKQQNLTHYLYVHPLLRKMSTASAPGEKFEVRQTSATDDWHPDPSKSLPLDKARQALLDDIIALYSCEPTIERVKRYTPDCVYDDQFVYANDRYEKSQESL
jgi:hypothetical protein